MRRVAICCIDHALLLVSSVDITLDDEAQDTLDTFSSYREKMIHHLEAHNALKTPEGSARRSFVQKLPSTESNSGIMNYFLHINFMFYSIFFLDL